MCHLTSTTNTTSTIITPRVQLRAAAARACAFRPAFATSNEGVPAFRGGRFPEQRSRLSRTGHIEYANGPSVRHHSCVKHHYTRERRALSLKGRHLLLRPARRCATTRSDSREGALPERREPKFGRGGSCLGLVRVQKDEEKKIRGHRKSDDWPSAAFVVRLSRLSPEPLGTLFLAQSSTRNCAPCFLFFPFRIDDFCVVMLKGHHRGC